MSGFFEIVKAYPSIVRGAFRLAIDEPCIPKLRIDKGEEKRARKKREEEAKRSQVLHDSGIPPLEADLVLQRTLHTIYLQWRDKKYKRWVDTTITINRDTKKLERYESWFLWYQHEGSGAIDAIIFASPLLLLGSPYIIVRNSFYSRSEEKEQMSRHSIALMRGLQGLLDEDTESLLRTALKKEFAFSQKMRQLPSLEEACAILDCCTLITTDNKRKRRDCDLHSFSWFDSDGDRIAYGSTTQSKSGTSYHATHVFTSVFEEDEAKELIERFGKPSLE